MLTLKVYTDPSHEDAPHLVAEGADLPALLADAFRMFSEIYCEDEEDRIFLPSAVPAEWIPAARHSGWMGTPARFASVAALFDYVGRAGGRTWVAEIYCGDLLAANLLAD